MCGDSVSVDLTLARLFAAYFPLYKEKVGIWDQMFVWTSLFHLFEKLTDFQRNLLCMLFHWRPHSLEIVISYIY